MYTTPPTYLSSFAIPTKDGKAAELLIKGDWRGHGELVFGVYDIRTGTDKLFSVQLPSTREYPELVAVTATSPKGETFCLYDPRKHPASLYAVLQNEKEFPHKPAEPFSCPSCDCESFAVAVGFEMPSDSSGPDDTSWFALAVECSKCKWRDIIFDDETA